MLTRVQLIVQLSYPCGTSLAPQPPCCWQSLNTVLPRVRTRKDLGNIVRGASHATVTSHACPRRLLSVVRQDVCRCAGAPGSSRRSQSLTLRKFTVFETLSDLSARDASRHAQAPISISGNRACRVVDRGGGSVYLRIRRYATVKCPMAGCLGGPGELVSERPSLGRQERRRVAPQSGIIRTAPLPLLTGARRYTRTMPKFTASPALRSVGLAGLLTLCLAAPAHAQWKWRDAAARSSTATCRRPTARRTRTSCSVRPASRCGSS